MVKVGLFGCVLIRFATALGKDQLRRVINQPDHFARTKALILGTSNPRVYLASQELASLLGRPLTTLGSER